MGRAVNEDELSRLVEKIIAKINSRIEKIKRELGDPLIYVETVDQFNQLLGDYDLIVAVFSTTWCNPCAAYTPVFKKVARKYINEPNIVFVYIDADKLPEIADKYHVDNLPTTLFFVHGHIADVKVGVTTYSNLDERVAAFLKELEKE